jgi:hypothetical protein
MVRDESDADALRLTDIVLQGPSLAIEAKHLVAGLGRRIGDFATAVVAAVASQRVDNRLAVHIRQP